MPNGRVCFINLLAKTDIS